MKVDLIFPPFWGDPSVPHIAIPALTSYLKQNGHNVRQWDLNLEALHYLFADRTLAWAQETVEERLKGEHDSSIPHMDTERFIAVSLKAPYIRRRIPWALGVFSDATSFQNMEILAEAKGVLNEALELVAAAHHPSRLELFRYFGFDSRFSYERSADLLSSLNHPEENPFERFYRTEGVVDRIAERNPAVVGFSISNQVQLIPALCLANMIRDATPGTKICFGGNIVTRISKSLASVPALFDIVDYWIVYEGEDPLLALVDALEGGNDLASVPNLTYRREDGTIYSTPNRTGRNVNKVGPPDFDDLPLESYFQPGIILPYNSAVGGCYWRRCTFCEITGGYSNTFQSRDVDLITEDIRYLCERYGTSYIYFTDEAQSPQRLLSVSNGIIENGLDIRWMGMAKVDNRFTKEMFDTIFSSGCRVLMFGVESTSQPVLKSMLKGTSPRVYRRVLYDSHHSGIWTHSFFMFDFPTETFEQALETVDFIDQNREILDSIGSSQFEMGHLTPVYLTPEKFGVHVIPNHTSEDLKLYNEYTTETGKTQEESTAVMNRLNAVKQNFYIAKGYPQSFSQAIGNSVNFITLLLGALADQAKGPEELGSILSQRISSRECAHEAATPVSNESGTLVLDPDLSFGVYTLPDGENGMTACVMFHPSIPNQSGFKVMPMFTAELLEVIREAPCRPSEVVAKYTHQRQLNDQQLGIVGDTIVALYDAGLVRVS
jgi:anaerobic magnesium-protoporphyrin IX monomethyl ester cyclase